MLKQTAWINLIGVLLVAAAAARSPIAPLPAAASPEPRDAASPEAVIQALYSVLCHPGWNRSPKFT